MSKFFETVEWELWLDKLDAILIQNIIVGIMASKWKRPVRSGSSVKLLQVCSIHQYVRKKLLICEVVTYYHKIQINGQIRRNND